MDTSKLVVYAQDAAYAAIAEQLASELGLDAVDPDAAANASLALCIGREGLALVGSSDEPHASMQVRGDFSRLSKRTKPGNLHRELLVRAAKVKDVDGAPIAVDATAGLGDDSFLLAAAGFRVLLFERNQIIGALLKDALARASATPSLADIAARMHVSCADSTLVLPHLDEQPDIVLLDPMFPAKGKSSAAKKKLQLLQRLEEPCRDEQELLDAAFSARPRKIVVKRPVKGPHLANRKPDYTLAGKAIRYDCYVIARN